MDNPGPAPEAFSQPGLKHNQKANTENWQPKTIRQTSAKKARNQREKPPPKTILSNQYQIDKQRKKNTRKNARVGRLKRTRIPPSHPLETQETRNSKLPTTNLSLTVCAASGPPPPTPRNIPAIPSSSMKNISRKKTPPASPIPRLRTRNRKPPPRRRKPPTPNSKLKTRNPNLPSPKPPKTGNPSTPLRTPKNTSSPWNTATASKTLPSTYPTAAGRKTSATPEDSKAPIDVFPLTESTFILLSKTFFPLFTFHFPLFPSSVAVPPVFA